MRVHRVCIATGASVRALAEIGRRELTVSAIARDGYERFTTGRITIGHGFVHVFDENTLPIVLSELSTTPDFLEYLHKKEALFESNRFGFAESELDLLGYYLWNNREFPHRGAPRFRVEPYVWQQVETDSQFLAAREENKVSIFWDGLIEYLTKLYMNQELERGNELPVSEQERVLRIMATETRFSRRLLAKWIIERADLAKDGYIASFFPSLQEEVLYVLLIGPGDKGQNHADYRKARLEQLYARCIAAKASKPDRRIMVGIALDARGVVGSSEDFIFMDTGDWSRERIEQAGQLRNELGYFVEGRARETRVSEAEYPGT